MKHPTARSLTLARVSLVLLLVWAAVVAAGKLVWADEGDTSAAGSTITLELPLEMAVGKEANLVASLTGSGPLAGAEVVFLAAFTFAGTEGEVELGRAVTDEQGIARLTYVPRSQGEMNIAARYAGNDQLEPAEVSQKVTVQPGPQLYQETAGARIPGIGVWLLIAVLGTVWSTYLIVTVILGLIARKGLAPQSERSQVQEPARVTAGVGGTTYD